ISSGYCGTITELGLWKEEYIESELVDKIDICLMIYGTLLIVIVWLNYILQQKKIVTIVNKLYSIYYNLMICNRYTFKSDYCLYVFPLVNFFLCGSLVIVDMIKSGIYITSIWATPLIISSWVLMQYTILLNIIFQLLKCMSTKILELGDIDIENYYRTVLRSKVSLREFVIKDINFVKYAVMQLCDICDQIADFYAIPLLMIIVYTITRTIFDVYYLIVSLFLLDEFELFKLYFFVGILCLIIGFNLIVFTSNITRITREFSKIPHYISLLLNRCAMNSTTKEAVSYFLPSGRKLLDFLRDTSNRDVNFTTYGIITLNGTLLQTIFGTMVTYLIILVQFRN
ncbi:GSCOCT00014159001.2-RA-CDS, partial [Cotesia congregata]